ncbi:aldo/keto reductase family protein [Streptomyces sp. TLI_235]|nr:aldo/keto reductase [Streptomyces sp. TLI_235]PBC67491.1 aldo/keto reductase family protein [Streptomyces sp. TLI_235]
MVDLLGEMALLGLEVGDPLEPGGSVRGRGRAAVRRSLDRLGTDRLDLLYGHVDDPATPLRETVDAFAGAVADGLAEQIGMSNQGVGRFARSRELARRDGLPSYVALQQRHTFLPPAPDADFDYQVSLDEPMLAYAADHPEVTVLAYSALLNGAYTDPGKPLPAEYDHPWSARALAELHAVARETGATANQVVYAWLLGGSPAVLPLVGVSRLGQLDEALDAVDLDLTCAQRARLDATRAVARLGRGRSPLHGDGVASGCDGVPAHGREAVSSRAAVSVPSVRTVRATAWARAAVCGARARASASVREAVVGVPGVWATPVPRSWMRPAQ